MILYASFDEVNEICKKIWEQGDIGVIVQAFQGLAGAFILFNWYRMYAEKNLANKPLDMYAIMDGIFYMALVLSAEHILTLADDFMVKFGTYISTRVTLPNGIWDSYLGEDPAMAGPNAAYQIIRTVILWFIVVIDYTYFIARGFLIFFLKLTFPLVLALGAIKENRTMVWRFIKTYLAVYLTGYGYLIAISFTNAVFIFGQQSSTFSIFPILLLLVVLFAKKLMYAEVNSIAKHILS